MRVYPISVPRHRYRGTNAVKRRSASEYNRHAMLLEQHLNSRIIDCSSPIQLFLYADLARELSLDLDLVQQILFRVNGGHNGLTVARSEAALADAIGGR